MGTLITRRRESVKQARAQLLKNLSTRLSTMRVRHSLTSPELKRDYFIFHTRNVGIMYVALLSNIMTHAYEWSDKWTVET